MEIPPKTWLRFLLESTRRFIEFSLKSRGHSFWIIVKIPPGIWKYLEAFFFFLGNQEFKVPFLSRFCYSTRYAYHILSTMWRFVLEYILEVPPWYLVEIPLGMLWRFHWNLVVISPDTWWRILLESRGESTKNFVCVCVCI